MAIAAVGTAQAGSCSNNKTLDGPATKIEVFVKNKSDTAIDVAIGHADNKTEIRAQSDSYKLLRSTAIEPGTKIDITQNHAPRGHKVYSVALLDTLNIFTVNNISELSTGTTIYKAEASLLEYRQYNQDPASV